MENSSLALPASPATFPFLLFSVWLCASAEDFKASASRGFGEAAEAAFAAAKVFHGVGQVGGFEFGPHARGEEKFGVGAFPKHEVAEATVAAGADEQVHIESGAAGVRDFAEALGEFALRNFEARNHPAGGAQDGFSRGIIHGDAQFESAAGGREFFRGVNGFGERGRDAVAPADDAQADSGGGAPFGFRTEIFLEQDEQRGDFAERTAPIIGGERVESESANAEAGGGADDAANGFDSGAMAFGANQAASGGPASIAIEEDGDVEFRLRLRLRKHLQSTFVHRVSGQKNLETKLRG
jgi:hypothetical protein